MLEVTGGQVSKRRRLLPQGSKHRRVRSVGVADSEDEARPPAKDPTASGTQERQEQTQSLHERPACTHLSFNQ